MPSYCQTETNPSHMHNAQTPKNIFVVHWKFYFLKHLIRTVGRHGWSPSQNHRVCSGTLSESIEQPISLQQSFLMIRQPPVKCFTFPIWWRVIEARTHLGHVASPSLDTQKHITKINSRLSKVHGGFLWDPREHADSREKAQIVDFIQLSNIPHVALMSKWQKNKHHSSSFKSTDLRF